MNDDDPGPRATEQLSVGQLAERSAVTVSALHFYERRGLIASTRTAGNQRRYARSVLRRVAVIRAAQRAGIPLALVAESFVELPTDAVPTRDDWQRLSAHWRGELDARINALEKLRGSLGGCIGCGCLSLEECGFVNPSDLVAGQGPGARAFDGPGPTV
ncbi:redox-sensitive transcriptional activator SoxR [Arthrobacter livingstonensis]|uniref:Redox-sensitive transcriptional activator SoxR n=1 Tax=Arthrobacter livingstonensis TaxID=670078 RepID=A0A2V5LFP7_9MICC|nr:redox-sensitive transcriptional activator SoxR [Arthrobacter livingstonensis]PYI68653.1 redox-sensitive transcriptional activator SoxR [Arthrobacter livingstonensis]